MEKTDNTNSGNSQLIASGFPCPICGGSDPLALYKKKDTEGNVKYDGLCYSTCGFLSPEVIEEHFELTDLEKYKPRTAATPLTKEEIERVEKYSEVKGWRERKLPTYVCERFGVRTKFDDEGKVTYRYYPTHENGKHVGYHVRNQKVKEAKNNGEKVDGAPFFALGKVSSSCDLFGQSLFPSGGKFLVITGGEEDAQAVWKALKSDKYETACVSPIVGEGNAVQQIANQYKYVNSFQKVILMFDNDEVGKKATREVTKLFGFGKVVSADLIYKDPCEYLKKADGVNQLKKAFWEAMPKKPSQVLTVADILERAMQVPEMGLSLPWKSATDITLGIRRGDIHVVGAAPKIGKTEHQHQLVKHMTEVHNERVGVMSLEENPVKTLKKVAGKYAGKQFTKPPHIGGYTEKDMRDAFALLDEKIEFYSSDGVRDYEEILETIRYWASKGIWFFIIDPLTALVAEHTSSEANDILNSFMSKLASMAMELELTFFLYSHVNPVKSGIPHDQGGDVLSSQFTGSRAMEKWAHYGWGIQRNRTEKDEVKRNTARVTLLFDREFGEYCEYYAFYDKLTNDWSEIDYVEEDRDADALNWEEDAVVMDNGVDEPLNTFGDEGEDVAPWEFKTPDNL